MTVPVLAAAKHLAKRSGWSLSNLELQKLIYIAHMFYLGRKDGEPLVHGAFQAWEYGPVHPDLYHHVKMFGSAAVRNVFHAVPDIDGSPEARILDEAYDHLGKLGPGRLVAITHQPHGAWSTRYVPGARGRMIPNQAILDEYRKTEHAAGSGQ